MHVDLLQKVNNYLISKNIDGAALELESLLRTVTSDRFSTLAMSHFTNSSDAVFEHIKKFVSACQDKFEVRTVYLEMNGFDINYDRWYFDSFAYTVHYNVTEDMDWLCDWSSPDWKQFTLCGLEKTQDDFRWYSENKIYENKTHDKVMEIASLLVMVRFIQLIRDSIPISKSNSSIPLLATAHDFDIFGRLMI
ncbi:hypothetical protein [Rubinisphaera italica]|uniref:Uncharacterized protein n=1 Tax=Rubinisphaera italica TaxID=2527969 RepID=A0A5C5XDL1_9PLAN|nr:hypothetical protein [Rubinisphaera italica]TWT61090.1 hypothetical protein Pan54_18240 [Rubinisphaera italica]